MTNLELLCSYLGIKMRQGKFQIALSQEYCNPTNIAMEAQLKLNKEGGGRRVDAMLYMSLIGSLSS